MQEGNLALTFRRDERAIDLIYEVEVSNDLTSWTVIARGANGGPLTGHAAHSPVISETSASAIASVGVIREVTVRDVVAMGAKRFLRLRVRLATP